MKVKKIPLRTCLGCRQTYPKKELLRIVRTPDGGVLVDPTGKKSGRGAYICPKSECLELTLKGSMLEKALEVPLSIEIKANLRANLSDIIGSLQVTRTKA